MSRSDNIPATSYWARKKVEFEAEYLSACRYNGVWHRRLNG